MSYQTNRDLPRQIRETLPEAAQDLYRIAFNCALQWYGDETKAEKTAWSAVKQEAASPYGLMNGFKPLASPTG